MRTNSILDELRKLAPHYSPHVYQFVMDSLAYTVTKNGQRRHVTGPELAHGARELALDLWGPMARHVLNSWGIRSTEDIGHVVFTMVAAGILSKTDQDKPDDFNHIYDFLDAFDKSYTPEFDEHGHIRRKLPQHGQPIAWLPFLTEQGIN